MYVTVALKDVIKRIMLFYYCNCFSFLIEKKYWSINTELNDKSFITVYVFLIFNDVKKCYDRLVSSSSL